MTTKQKQRTPAQMAACERMKAALVAKRAAGEIVYRPRKARTPKEAPPPPVWSFNADDKGEVAIIDQGGEGIELSTVDAERLRVFLNRVLPHGVRPLAEMLAVDAARQAERV